MDHVTLINRIPSASLNQGALATENIAKVEVDEQLVQEVIACLRSSDEQDIVTGLRFAECLGSRPDFCRIAGASFGSIAALIRKLLSDPRPAVRLVVIGAFAAFRNCYLDYKESMVSLFHSPDAQTRCEALSKADTFLSGLHLRNLLTFRDDSTVIQTASGERRYALRDLALEAAERVAGRSFDCGIWAESRDGVKISWRRWTFFTSWLDRVQRRASEV